MLPNNQLPIKSYSYPLPLWLSYYHLQTTPAIQPDKNPHRHQYYELLFFKQARNLKHYLDFTPYVVEPQTLFFVGPRQIHFVDSMYSNSEYELYVITFSEDFLAQITSEAHYMLSMNELFTMGTTKVDHRLASAFVSIWQQIEEEITSKDLGYEKMIINLFRNLLILLKRQVTLLDYGFINKIKILDSFKNFQRLLDEHCLQQWSVRQYADALQLTTRQLHRICSLVKNTSPQEIIHNRLNIEAKRYLFYTILPIKEVAFQLGFNDQSYFSRFFNRLNKMSPEAFRLKMSQEYH